MAKRICVLSLVFVFYLCLLTSIAKADIVDLRPNADGDATDWDIAGTSGWEATSDNSDDSSIQTGTELEYHSLHLEGMGTGASIESVQMIWRCKCDKPGSTCGGGPEKIDTHFDFTGDLQGDLANEAVDRNAFTNETGATNHTTMPNGTAWSVDAINEMQAVIYSDTVASGEYLNCSEVYVTVWYAPVAAQELENVTQSILFSSTTPRQASYILAETQPITASCPTLKSKKLIKAIIQSLDIMEICRRARVNTMHLSQAFNISSAVTSVKFEIIIRYISQALNIENVVGRFISLSKIISQSLNFSGLAIRLADITRIFTQNISIATRAAGGRFYKKLLSIALESTGSITKPIYTLRRIFSDSFGISSTVVRLSSLNRILTQTINLSVITRRLIDLTMRVSAAISFILKLLIPCSAYKSESSCKRAGYHWRNGACHDTPAPTTTTTTTAVSAAPSFGIYVPPPEVDIKYMQLPVLREIAPGESTMFSISVKNTAASAYTGLSVDVSGIPADWVTVDPKELSLEPAESKAFNIWITMPADAQPIDYKVTVKVANVDIEAENYFMLRIKSVPPDYDKPIVTRAVEINKKENKTNVNLTVTNPVRYYESVEVIENIPKDLANTTDEVEFKTLPSEIIKEDPIVMWAILGMAAGEERTISYSVSKILSEFAQYIYWPLHQLNIISEEVEELGYVDLKTPMLYQGKTSTLILNIRNPEELQHTYNVTFELPEGWEIEPEIVKGIIEAGENKTFELALSVPKDARLGIHILRLTLAWDENIIIREFSQEVKPAYAMLAYLIFYAFISTTAIIVLAFVIMKRKTKEMERIKEVRKLKEGLSEEETKLEEVQHYIAMGDYFAARQLLREVRASIEETKSKLRKSKQS